MQAPSLPTIPTHQRDCHPALPRLQPRCLRLAYCWLSSWLLLWAVPPVHSTLLLFLLLVLLLLLLVLLLLVLLVL